MAMGNTPSFDPRMRPAVQAVTNAMNGSQGSNPSPQLWSNQISPAGGFQGLGNYFQTNRMAPQQTPYSYAQASQGHNGGGMR